MNAAPILYAEDEENDGFLLRRAFAKAGIANPLEVVTDGKEAIDYLNSVVTHAQARFPAMILLDLKMPLKTGLEVLGWIRQQPRLRTTPVIVLTSSSQESDVHKAYLLGANGYLVKPPGPEQFVAMVERIRDFWLSLNVNPPDPKVFNPIRSPRL